jgi:hypothetical protein
MMGSSTKFIFVDLIHNKYSLLLNARSETDVCPSIKRAQRLHYFCNSLCVVNILGRVVPFSGLEARGKNRVVGPKDKNVFVSPLPTGPCGYGLWSRYVCKNNIFVFNKL